MLKQRCNNSLGTVVAISKKSLGTTIITYHQAAFVALDHNLQDLDSSLGKKVLEAKVTEEHYLLPSEAHHAAEPPLEERTDYNLAEAVEEQRGPAHEGPK